MKEQKYPINFKYKKKLSEYLEEIVSNKLKKDRFVISNYDSGAAIFPDLNESSLGVSNYDILREEVYDIIGNEVQKLLNTDYKFYITRLRGGGTTSYPKFTILDPISISITSYDFNTRTRTDDSNLLKISLGGVRIAFTYNSLKYNESKNIYQVDKSGITGNNIYIRDVELITENREGNIYTDEIELSIEKQKKEIDMVEKKLNQLKSKLSNKKYIANYLKKNKISVIETSLLKTKLIVDAIKSNEKDSDNEESLITNINEIIELEL